MLHEALFSRAQSNFFNKNRHDDTKYPSQEENRLSQKLHFIYKYLLDDSSLREPHEGTNFRGNFFRSFVLAKVFLELAFGID